MATAILNLPQIVPQQIDEYLTVNEAIELLEASANDFLLVDLSTENALISASAPDYQMLRNFMFRTFGNDVARTVTFSPRKRHFAVENGGTSDLDVVIGLSSIAVPAGSVYQFYADGSVDGLVRIM